MVHLLQLLRYLLSTAGKNNNKNKNTYIRYNPTFSNKIVNIGQNKSEIKENKF